MGDWNEIEEGEAWLRLSITYWSLCLLQPRKAEVCGEGLGVQQKIRKHVDKRKSQIRQKQKKDGVEAGKGEPSIPASGLFSGCKPQVQQEPAFLSFFCF